MISKYLADEALYRYGAIRAWAPFVFRRPIGFFLYITGNCNLNCQYCWQREETQQGTWGFDSSRSELHPEEWVSVVNNLPRNSFLGISGGEATLSSAFAPIVRAACRRLRITINTNGVALTEKHLNLLTDPAIKNVSISLDGFSEVHDHYRSGKGLFEQITRNITRFNELRTIKRSRASLTIKMVLTNENIDQLEDFRRYCDEQLKADTLNISFEKINNHTQYSLRYCMDLEELSLNSKPELFPYQEPEKITKILTSSIKQNNQYHCKIVLYPRMATEKEICNFLKNKGKNVYRPCYLPFALVTVLPNGEVIPCLSLGIGNVRDFNYDLLRVLDNGKYQDFCNYILSKGSNIPSACNVCCFLKVKSN